MCVCVTFQGRTPPELCFHTAPCFANLSSHCRRPPAGTGITTDLGYTCPEGCESVYVFATHARGRPSHACGRVRTARPRQFNEELGPYFSFITFPTDPPNMSGIKSGQAAPCADVCPLKLHPSRHPPPTSASFDSPHAPRPTSPPKSLQSSTIGAVKPERRRRPHSGGPPQPAEVDKKKRKRKREREREQGTASV